jgi:glyoxylate carboligase
VKLKGAQILLQCLKEEGVDTIFGYPGGSVLPIYDAIYGSDIRHILVRHEQGAAHAADAYARVTGKTGVCIATSGPGATNLVTGIATANMDSVPMVCFTGQVASPLIGKDAFQEADITGITMPITTTVIRDTLGFSVSPTARLSILYPLLRNMVATRVNTPGLFSTVIARVCFFIVYSSPSILSNDSPGATMG